MAAYVLDLLAFIEEKVAEAQNEPSSREAAMTEAGGALPVIRDRLREENKTALTQLLLLGLIEEDLPGMGRLPPDAFPQAVADFRGRIGIAKNIIQQGGGHSLDETTK